MAGPPATGQHFYSADFSALEQRLTTQPPQQLSAKEHIPAYRQLRCAQRVYFYVINGSGKFVPVPIVLNSPESKR